MSKIRFVGLDVHADTIAVAVAELEGEVRSLGMIPNRLESIRKLVAKLGPAQQLKVCYEAGPCGYVLYWQLTVGRAQQQENAQAVTGAVLILAGVLARSYQVAQRFMIRIGDPHRCQVAGAITPRRFRRVAAIGLDAIAGFTGTKLGATTSQTTPRDVRRRT